jgi:probable HAF family extracellular repeat protein
MPFRKAVLSLAILLLATTPLALAQGTYTQIDFPGAVYTQAYGINGAGDVVGGYNDSSGNNHGFFLSGGVYTTIDDPDVPQNFAYGINDVGQIVGSNGLSSFIYDLQTQTFTTVSFPSSHSSTVAFAINNAGVVVGYLLINSNNTVGFEYKDGSYLAVRRPGFSETDLVGINGLGQALGDDQVGATGTGFLYVGGKFQTIRVPAKLYTAFGLNDLRAIVGQYRPSGQNASQGFVYQNGNLQEIAFPGSVSGLAFGINNSGMVSGGFADSAGNSHGFTWTPPADAAKK